MGLRTCCRSGDDKGRPGWRFSFEYDEELKDRLKQLIPPSLRAWYPETKEWWIDAGCEQVLLQLFPDFEAHLRQQPLF